MNYENMNSAAIGRLSESLSMSTEFPILEGLDEYSGEYINKFELYKAKRGSLDTSHADF